MVNSIRSKSCHSKSKSRYTYTEEKGLKIYSGYLRSIKQKDIIVQKGHKMALKRSEASLSKSGYSKP
jgi:hypothetical protein